jgi:hypothetical protein
MLKYDPVGKFLLHPANERWRDGEEADAKKGKRKMKEKHVWKEEERKNEDKRYDKRREIRGGWGNLEGGKRDTRIENEDMSNRARGKTAEEAD